MLRMCRILTGTIVLFSFSKIPFLYFIILALLLHECIAAFLWYYKWLPCISHMFWNDFIEIQTKNECNLLLLNNMGSSGFNCVLVTELNKTFDEILIRPHKAWYLGNIKCDLSFYITLTLMSLVLNKIISLDVCTLMMYLLWKQSIQFLHQCDRGSTIDFIHCWFLNIFVMECFWKQWYFWNNLLCLIYIVHGW